MNRDHLAAFLWLRWRLRVNQFRKAGPLNAVLFTAFAAGCLVGAVVLFAVGVVVGLFAFRDAPAYAHLFAWDGIVLALLFGWGIGLVSDLQRSEALSLDRFLHLPVSASGVFLINYLSSLFSLTLIVFVPGMVGLVLGQAVSLGPLMLLGLPLLAAALFALTAVTYQFQGWLASLMANPRRRRTIVVLITAGFIVVAQLPNLINVARPWEAVTKPANRQVERMAEASNDLAAGRIDQPEYTRRLQEINRQFKDEQEAAGRESLDTAVRVAHWLSAILPPGWLPLGAEGLADGRVLPALLGTAGLTLIGAYSLRRAYRTTLRLYTGEYTAGGGDRGAIAAAPAAPPDPARVPLVERRLPWVSEYASAVATAGFRSMTRAPEAKMAALTPLIMVVIFGGLAASAGGDPPVPVRPLLAYGVAAMVLFLSGAQLLGNPFGYDRAGFRAFVLSPAPRGDILLGKNLAAAPLLLGLGLLGLLLAGAVYPMRADHYPAVLAQVLSTYLIVCMLFNVVAIAAPIPLAPGSLQPASIKIGPVLLQLLIMSFLPVALLPVLAPYGLEVLLDQLDVIRGVPVSLPLSLGVLVLTGLTYRWVVRRQGEWLTAREQAILEVVAARAE
ncbi:MAG TPA: hypothetical protein VH092_29855 [Urbifossiella sp.]|jgi:hypothetical protein|nr:hypothetical protein [Urbifossiella sp.]